MPTNHAVLSASSSHRWLSCPPSGLANHGAKDTPSEFALQGTDAHSLCEYKLRTLLGENLESPVENLTYYDEEMESSANDYTSFDFSEFEKVKELCTDPLILIEQRMDFSKWVPEGFGTGDCIIVSDETIKVIDFKYGLGILVGAENNPQMVCYALGALALFDGIYDIKNVEMTIFQSRRDNVSTFTIIKEELLTWAEEVLKPTALLASKGEGEYKAGEHCQFCKIKATCRKRAEYNLKLVRYDFKMPEKLEDAEVEVILSKVDELISWANDIKEYALKAALHGKKWSDFKLVEGRSNRKYTNDKAVAVKVKEA